MDRPGLVAALAQVISGHGANILAADQHRNEQAGQFFQRIRFDVSALLTDRGTLERAEALVKAHVDVLPGAVTGPAGDVQLERPRPRRLGDDGADRGEAPAQSPEYRCSRHGSP